MSNIIEQLLSGGIKGLAEGLGNFAIALRTAITGSAPIDPAKQAELLAQAQLLQAAAEKAAMDYDTAQMQGAVDVAKLEATSTDKFTSRWRPFIGWVCGVGLAMQYVVGPLFTFFANWYLTSVHQPTITFPTLNTELLVTLLFGMLGLGAMRTIEKLNGKAGH